MFPEISDRRPYNSVTHYHATLYTTAIITTSINQSVNLFVMKHSTRDVAVTALTGTTGLKSAYGSPK